MSHLRLVPPLASDDTEPAPFADAESRALAFFQAASGLCLCRDCTKARHPAFAR